MQGDDFLHQQDVRRPVGRTRAHSAACLAATLDATVRGAAGTGSKKRVAGLRLRATDIDWSHGDGAEVSGPGEALIMVASGRASAIAQLAGASCARASRPGRWRGLRSRDPSLELPRPRSDPGVRLTTEKRALEGGELLTTAAAVVISTALYLRSGHSYLAHGVVGDIAGLALLTTVLVTCHRRVRHEALVCLAGIGVVLVADPQWPLRRSSGFWWLVITAGLAGYLAARQHLLSRMPA